MAYSAAEQSPCIQEEDLGQEGSYHNHGAPMRDDDDHSDAGSVGSSASHHSLPVTILSSSAMPSHGRKVSVVAGSFIMLNTVVGGGISLVATPFAARCLGLATFIVVEAIFGFFSSVSLHLLGASVSVADNFNLFEVAEKYLGKWAGVVMAGAIVLNNVFVSVGFCQIAFDACDAVFPHIPSAATPLIVGAMVAITVPISGSRDVTNVEPMALPCTILWMTFVILLFANFGVGASKSNLSDTWEYSSAPLDVLFGKGIPAINLSWTCQFNAPPLFASLHPRTRKSMTKVGFAMSWSASSLYMLLGTAAYLYYGTGLQDDIMESINVEHGGKGLEWGRHAVIVAETCLGVSVIASLPFFLIEARNMGHGLIFGGEGSEAGIKTRMTETLVLTASAFFVAFATRGNLSVVLAVVGMLPANIIAWGLPGLLAVGMHKAHPTRMPWYSTVLGCALVCFGCILLPLGVVALTGQFGKESD